MCFYTALGGVTRGSRRCLTEVWGASRAIPALGELGGEGEESGAAYLRAGIDGMHLTFLLPLHSFPQQYLLQSRCSRRSAAATCERRRVRVVERASATRNGELNREGKQDVSGSWKGQRSGVTA